MAENGWPGEVWLILQDPEFAQGVKEDGDMFFECWGDLVDLAVKLDG